MKFFPLIAGLVAVAISEIRDEPEIPLPTAMPALTTDTICPGQWQEHFAIKIVEILPQKQGNL
jgi:hypothetical protein